MYLYIYNVSHNVSQQNAAVSFAAKCILVMLMSRACLGKSRRAAAFSENSRALDGLCGDQHTFKFKRICNRGMLFNQDLQHKKGLLLFPLLFRFCGCAGGAGAAARNGARSVGLQDMCAPHSGLRLGPFKGHLATPTFILCVCRCV
eukprot:COSAG06_NODE_11527_length_1496_cov_559.531138_2_plen_146_part_00